MIKGFRLVLAMMLLSGICNAQDSDVKKKLEREHYLVSYDAKNDRFIVYDNAGCSCSHRTMPYAPRF